jgi:hypothetical protein
MRAFYTHKKYKFKISRKAPYFYITFFLDDDFDDHPVFDTRKEAFEYAHMYIDAFVEEVSNG